jgi:hypothetical protein
VSTASPAIALTLNTLATIADPTAQWGNLADRVQLQNASPFILEVLAGGQTYTIQSFTAQTIPTGSTGASMTVVPTTGPAGTQGSLTAVWLLTGQQPDMADGQLTGAAQYAVGLGSELGSATNSSVLSNVGVQAAVPLNPNTRTLLVQWQWFMLTAQIEYPTISVVGNTTGRVYCNRAPYLLGTAIVPPYTEYKGLTVVPVNPLLDPVVTVAVRGASGVNFASVSFDALGDTLLFTEDVFYDGSVAQTSQLVNTAVTTLLLTGPARLLTCSLEAGTAMTGIGQLFKGLAPILTVPGSVGTTLSMTFPRSTRLQAGGTMSVSNSNGTGSVTGAVVYAYP